MHINMCHINDTVNTDYVTTDRQSLMMQKHLVGPLIFPSYPINHADESESE